MKAWEGTFEIPISGRSSKPRSTGHTMVIDKGLGIRATQDLIQMGSYYSDVVKLTFGTSAFYDRELIKEKLSILRDEYRDHAGGT